MKHYLIDNTAQKLIADRIDLAVKDVLMELPNHGGELGLTPVLGSALRRQSFKQPRIQVEFNYRQLNAQTEEPHMGADGGFVVRIRNASGTWKKSSLFQSKLITGTGPIRKLTMSKKEATRLKKQARDMLNQTNEAVAMFYTHRTIYVVDASRYKDAFVADIRTPFSEEHRLVTLGTYLGRWMSRCTRGDQNSDLVTKIEHLDGFKTGLTMDVISARPSIRWEDDPRETKWKQR